LAVLHGNDLFEDVPGAHAAFDIAFIDSVDWEKAAVDITAEVTSKQVGYLSIHNYLDRELSKSPAAVVFYDHGSGEIADFVTITEAPDDIRVRFYHCKGSGGVEPGRRIKDAYEVCGQAIKSVTWATKRQLREAIRRRVKSRPFKSRFLAGKGTLSEVDRLLGDNLRMALAFEIVIVQPGISRVALLPGVSALLASASDFLVRGGCAPLRIQASA